MKNQNTETKPTTSENSRAVSDSVQRLVMQHQLISCPACGSKAQYYTHNGEGNQILKGSVKVACMATDANHIGEHEVSDDWCPDDNETPWFIDRLDAVECWNNQA